MKLQDLKTYKIIEERDIPDLNSRGYILKHIKSGAKLMLLSNDDSNKVFSIGFRTPPNDSTGVPHIIEHSVLCGSKKFPAKDPFVELAKGSLNTFLNAMTYPDKTVYPIASCNDKDFQNLMDVYMDAVFYPNIYKREEIFKQEGWHYELDSLDGDIEISGVVYNEMKGAFSSPEGLMEREVFNSLFPDTTYGFESGGDPECIPSLTYNDFLDFHRRYYHPTNSYIYLYGDMDMAEKLEWIDKEYLSKFDECPIDSTVNYQKSFDKPIELHKEYSISSEETEEGNTYLTYNKVISDVLDKKLYIAFQILEYALMAPGAPLKQTLLDEGIGKDIMSNYDNGVLQPYFSIIAKNSDPDKKDRFVKVIEDVLRTQVKEGINKKSLLAGINVFEFKYREADFGSYPKGLMYGLQSFDSWLYDDNAPFLHLEANEIFAFLREQIDNGYFEKLIEDYLLNNNHASVVIIEPKKGLTAKKEAILADKLAEYKASLSKDELQKLIDDTAALKEYQTEPSTQEELETIPVLKRTDIKKEATGFDNLEETYDNTVIVRHNFFTNGIGYLNLFFDVSKVSDDLLPYLGILKSAFISVDTKNYSYLELNNEININCGGINPSFEIYSDTTDFDKTKVYFNFSARVLYEKLDFIFDIIQEIITSSNLADKKRLKEIIGESRSHAQMHNNNAGHGVAMQRAMSYFSPAAKFSDMTSGLEYYELLSDLDDNFDDKSDMIIAKLEALLKIIFRPENLLVGYTADDKGQSMLLKPLAKFKASLFTEEVESKPFILTCEKKNEGYKTAAKVQYVARTGNFRKAGFEYTGVLGVLKTIMGYDYLWNNIRVKGGAYGCMSGFSRNGDSYFVSYRDPNLEKTNEIYEGIPKFLENFDATERDMTKFIIGTISNIDTPLTAHTRGSRSMVAYLTNLSYEYIQKSRDAILNASVEDIRALAPMMKAVLEQNNICVVGGEEKVEAAKDLFMETKNLL